MCYALHAVELHVDICWHLMGVSSCMLLLHTDIDECIEVTSGCNQICSNTNGSYVCGCYSGYVLSDDKACITDASKELYEDINNKTSALVILYYST